MTFRRSLAKPTLRLKLEAVDQLTPEQEHVAAFVEGALLRHHARRYRRKERVGADVERERKCAQDVEGGLSGAGFVAPNLGAVGTGAFGEMLLGERLGFAHGGESGGKVGVGRGFTSWAMQRCCGGCCRGDYWCHLRVSLTLQSELGLF